MEYKKLGLREISKGLEMALTAGSLLPGFVNAVIVVELMNTVYQGFANGKGVSFVSESNWSFYGKEIPYTTYGLDKFFLGDVLWKSTKARELII